MKEKYLTQTWVVCLLATLCCVLWGSAFPGIKMGYRWCGINTADIGSQVLFAGCRFTLSGLLVILFDSLLTKKPLLPTKEAAKPVLVLAFFQTILQYFFFYIGMAHTTGVNGSIITATNVFLSILVASLLLKQEKLDARKVLGCTLGFAGVVLVNLQNASLEAAFAWNGEGFILISAASAAVSAAFIRKYSEKHPPVLLSGYQFFLGGLALILIGLLLGGRIQFHSGASIAILIYLAALSAVAYTLWGILLKYNPVSKVTVFGFINPVAGVVLSALILNEKGALSWITLLSLLLVSCGIFIVNRKKQVS